MSRRYSRIIVGISASFVAMVFLITWCLWVHAEPFFPDSEARVVNRKPGHLAVAECNYSGSTPILTCAYDSKV